MDPLALVAAVSIFTAGITVAIGGMMPSRGEGEALMKDGESVARQPEQANTIIRLFFIGAAIVESVAIYSLVIAPIILFANPFIHLIHEMKFNFLTYIFEIIDFFVLLCILKKLLYNPVISVLKKRKEFIDSRIREAEKAEKKAEEIRSEYERLSEELEEKRRQRLAGITKEVEEEKEKLLKRIREELDAERKKFLESLEEERRQVLRELKDKAIRLSLSFSSKVLSQMSDEHLHKKLLEIALETLKEIKEEGLKEELANSRDVLVESAYPLSAEDLVLRWT